MPLPPTVYVFTAYPLRFYCLFPTSLVPWKYMVDYSQPSGRLKSIKWLTIVIHAVDSSQSYSLQAVKTEPVGTNDVGSRH